MIRRACLRLAAVGLLLFTPSGSTSLRSAEPQPDPLLVRDIDDTFHYSVSSNPTQVVAVGAVAFFVADDGISGRELWRSDGTDAGTMLVKDINPGLLSSNPNNLTNANGTL